MKETTRIENYLVEIRRRPRQRSMRLRVRPDGTLKVTCNRGLSLRAISGFVRESENFIRKCLAEYEEKRIQNPAKAYVAGERFLFFGRELPLELVLQWEKRAKVTPLEGTIEMRISGTAKLEERREALHRFYKKQAALHFTERVRFFAERMQLFPSRLSLRGQRTRWGSCSAARELSLNWKLLAAPVEVIDYVIVHELAHIAHMNHSPAFWGLVARFYPDFEQCKKWLRANEFAIGQQFE